MQPSLEAAYRQDRNIVPAERRVPQGKLHPRFRRRSEKFESDRRPESEMNQASSLSRRNPRRREYRDLTSFACRERPAAVPRYGAAPPWAAAHPLVRARLTTFFHPSVRKSPDDEPSLPPSLAGRSVAPKRCRRFPGAPSRTLRREAEGRRGRQFQQVGRRDSAARFGVIHEQWGPLPQREHSKVSKAN